jgi:hypothetical protein
VGEKFVSKNVSKKLLNLGEEFVGTMSAGAAELYRERKCMKGRTFAKGFVLWMWLEPA